MSIKVDVNRRTGGAGVERDVCSRLRRVIGAPCCVEATGRGRDVRWVYFTP